MSLFSIETSQRLSKAYAKQVIDYETQIKYLNIKQTEDIEYRRRKPYSKYPNAHDVYDNRHYQREIENTEYWMNKFINDKAEFLL